jgi:hypothetical protein
VDGAVTLSGKLEDMVSQMGMEGGSSRMEKRCAESISITVFNIELVACRSEFVSAVKELLSGASDLSAASKGWNERLGDVITLKPFS